MIRDLVFSIIVVVGGSVIASARSLQVGPEQAITSLSQAIEFATPFDTLFVNPGQYHPQTVIVLDKPLTLLACGEVKVQAPPKSGIFEIRSDSVRIEGFYLLGVERSYIKDLAAIWVDFSADFSLVNNRIEDCFFGIFCTKAKRGLILGNHIEGQAKTEASSANAIHVWYCDSLLVKGNEVRRHRDGIYVEFTHNSDIEDNLSEHNLRYGLHFMFSHHNRYQRNRFSHNGAGVAVMFSNFIIMRHNVFIENWGRASYGVLLKEIRDSEVSENRFEKNTVAIYSEGCSRIQFRDNDFLSNGYALKLKGSSDDNDFTGNIFRGNSFDLALEARQNSNRFFRNYWDRYRGYDLDGDGIGDVLHRPMDLFSYISTRIDESIILLRSSFVEVLNFAERLSPALTPVDLTDEQPLMKAPQR